MVAVRIDAKGIRAAAKRLAEMTKRAEKLGPVLKVIASDIKTEIDNSFRGSVSPTGESWAPLKKSTVDRRRKRSAKPLIDTGTLRGSSYARADENSIVFGAAVIYAGTHQFGADIPVSKGPRTKRHGPRRKIKRKKRPRKALGVAAPVSPVHRAAAPAAKASSITIPARPFLPVDVDGKLSDTDVIRSINDRILEYFRTGKR